MRLLLATAQPHLRLSLELLLSEQPGVEVVGTASESEGLLALIHTTQPDMIITDWTLPGRPFPDLLKQITRSYHPQIIVLATEHDDIPDAKTIGVAAIVPKGASPKVLLQTFQQVRTQINKPEGDGL